MGATMEVLTSGEGGWPAHDQHRCLIPCTGKGLELSGNDFTSVGADIEVDSHRVPQSVIKGDAPPLECHDALCITFILRLIGDLASTCD